MELLSLRADLHNHSCLSPCADLSMSPALMARTARARGIDILALTDHNATLNCPAFAIACAAEGIIPLFGMEMNSSEEVHCLALFATPRDALAFGAAMEALLPALPWDPATFGDEAVVDEKDEVLELYGSWLGAALEADLDTLAGKAQGAGAIIIPAHVDRGMFSVYSQLGFLPPGPWDAVESLAEPPPQLRGGSSVISGSDAHFPEHLGRRPFLAGIEAASALELRDALEAFRKAVAQAKPGPEAEEYGGYAGLLADPRLDLYPEAETRRFFEDLRKSLRSGRLSLTRPSGSRRL
jgi:hypothetical protein